MKPVEVNADEIVNATLNGLGAENAQLRLQLNLERATSAALRVRLDEAEKAAELDAGHHEPPAG